MILSPYRSETLPISLFRKNSRRTNDMDGIRLIPATKSFRYSQVVSLPSKVVSPQFKVVLLQSDVFPDCANCWQIHAFGQYGRHFYGLSIFFSALLFGDLLIVQ